LGDELLADFEMVEDLAVEDDDLGPVLVVNGLASAGNVDDAQATVAKPNVLVKMIAGVIRPAVSQGRCRSFQIALLDSGGDYTEYPTHSGSMYHRITQKDVHTDKELRCNVWHSVLAERIFPTASSKVIDGFQSSSFRIFTEL
jgi:hypothetical protein